jgi:hypothetical protein
MACGCKKKKGKKPNTELDQKQMQELIKIKIIEEIEKNINQNKEQ